MLLTSWVESMRVAFEKSRKATLNPRRRLQLRSVPSAARQKIQRRVAIEQLEDRTLLTSLIINQITPGLGMTLNNSVLDPDDDHVSNYDTIVFEGVTIDASSGSGVSIDLDGLTFEDENGQPAPFKILFDDVTINSTAGVGVDIELANLLVDTIAVDSSTISGTVGNAFNVDLSNVTLNEFNVIDSTLAGQSGAGLTLGLSAATTVKETSIRRSTIDGVAIDVADGSTLKHTTVADSLISGDTGDDGVSVNVVDSVAEELRLTNNSGIQGVSINVADTSSGEAALLTELFIQDNIINDNQVGDGVNITLNNVDLFASITGNVIYENNGNGITFDHTDGDLSGVINDNTIANNAGHGIYFTPTTTDPVPTAAAPGVTAYEGIPGPTQQIDFSGARNEVQLITFAGVANGGTFQLQYTDNRGNQYTTGDLSYTATASQVKAALVALNSDIGFDDILVNGNFTDGYEVEFINNLGGVNINSLEVVNNNLLFATPYTGISQSTASNQSEVQRVLFSDAPLYGSYTLFFMGQSSTFAYDADATTIQNALIGMAAVAGYSGADIQVDSLPLGFEITVVDDPSNPLAYVDIDQIIANADGLNFDITVSEQQAGTNSLNEEQLLEFNYLNNPTGQAFTLTFNGNTTGLITIGPSNSDTINNIDAALETAFGTSGDDFGVTGSLANGFVIEFRGDLEHTNQPLLQVDKAATVTIDVATLTQGIGQNEIQSVVFPVQPGAGSFTLTLDTQTTTALAYNATAADVQSALEALSNIGVGNVSVTKVITGVNSFVFQVEFVGSNSLRPADYLNNPSGSVLTIDPSNLVAAVPNVKTVTAGTSLNEVQKIVVERDPDNTTPPTGSFTLTYAGNTTAAIDINATAHDIWSALTDGSIPELTPENVLVRGDALDGFEIEYVGALAGVNTPLITVDGTGVSDIISMTTKTVYVGGALRGIRNNLIGGNSGAGVEIDLSMYTSFYGDIVGNTISSNQTQGINLTAADPTTLQSVDFSLSVDSNAMDGNRGAAIAVNMEDTATGDLSVTNNTITRTQNDNLSSTPYTGDAIYVDLYGTDVSFEAFNQLRDLTIQGNFLGTDSSNATGLGNVGNGIGIHIEESTIIDSTDISNNVIINNTGDGLHFHREDDARVGAAAVDPIVGEERAVRIYDNTFSGNSDGIDILAQNGSLTTTDFEIKENVLSGNRRDGIKMHAEADALIFADIINNEINTNSMNGIESTSYSSNYFGTDKRDVAGTWIQNTISDNVQHGIDISGRIGNHQMLFIGLNGVDPVTGADRGNLISGNGRDGIQIAALIDRVDGRVKIANNQILSNSTGGVELTGAGLQSSIDNNLIAYNTGKGIDINSNAQTSFIRGNTITENTLDGLEVLSANRISHGEDGRSWTLTRAGQVTTSVTAVGNFIDNNGGRGVDLQTENQANSDFMFGDGTAEGANRIVSNGLEGFYVVTTASVGQDQDANSTAALDANGSVTNTDADMVLQVNTNYIQDNGVNSGFSANGLILRIGTMNSIYGGGSFVSSTQALGTGAAVGNEDASDSANGRSNVSVTGNVFEGNYGEDVYIESFTSTVPPNVTQDVWVAPSGNPAYRVLNGYQRDPLAKLNLVFEDNTGNGIDVTNTGAFYNTAEPEFKSRLNNYTAPVPDGPFNSATRRRNAQRIASRTGWNPITEASPNGPPDVGNVTGASIDPVSGRILIQADDVSALANGYAIEITRNSQASAFSDQSPIYGLFEIADIDYSSNTFTLLSTEGYDLTGYSTTGVWSTTENTRSFVYDGVGVSTFRIGQNYSNNNFDSYLSGFNSTIFYAGRVTGENGYAWDLWNPEENSFLTPLVQTFLTADISVAAPDPTKSSSVGPFIISFSEDVSLADVDVSDFTLLRDNVPVAEFNNTYAVLEQLDARTFRLNIDNVLNQLSDQNGEYELRLKSSGTGISDVKNDEARYSYIDPFNSIFDYTIYNNSPLLFGDVERFTIDQVAPTADIVDVSPDPRSNAVGDVVVNFSEDVTGVDLGDFTVTVDGGTPFNLASTPATLTQVTGSQYVLDLSKVTSLSGDYVLTLNSTGSSITDLAGNALNGQTGDPLHDDASDSWETDTLAPIPQFDDVTDPVPAGSDSGFTVYLNFSEDVQNLALSDFTLTDPAGNVTNLSTTSASITTINASKYGIILGTLADANGIYTLTYNAEGSAVVDVAGNDVAGSASESWQKGLEVDAPTAGIQEISPGGPRPSGSAVGIVTINFSEVVTGVTIDDFELLYDDGNVVSPRSLTSEPFTVVNGSTYQIDLSNVTTDDGLYTLTLLNDGTIQDLAGNKLVAGDSDSWRTGGTGPVATIQNLPDVLLTDAGLVTIDFNGEDVTGVNIDDFNLKLNGQDVSLAGLAVTALSASEYQIDLSSVTQLKGKYTLNLVAAGSNIRNATTNDPMLDDASESWVNSSTIDLTAGSPVFSDGTDTVAGDGIVGDGSASSQTLRAAIQEANALAGSNVINLAAGTYVLGLGGVNEDLAATGDLDIRDNLTIRGQGVDVTFIDASELDRVFQVFSGVTLNLENLTVTGGRLHGSDDGAGIRNSGTATLKNVKVDGNVSDDSAGGINNTGFMIIVDSTISNNIAASSGGGIRNTGTLQISRSTLNDNTTDRDGGALFNAGAGVATIANSTFSNNSSTRSGGAIRNTATLNATNNTLTQNDAGTSGGAIASSGTASLQNDLILGNTAGIDSELQGDYNSLGGNLIGLVGSATGFGASDILGVADPSVVLDSNLADNGGPTMTHALLLGSLAIDAGINSNVADLEQRGSQRILGSAVDIGAVEFGTFFVNSDLDTVDATPGDGIVADSNGNVTLRAAIQEANALAGDYLIVLGAGTYNLTEVGSDEDQALTGDLDITDTTGTLTIVGAGSGQTVIDATGLDDRVFDVATGADLTLEGLTVTGGNVIGGSGGGIRNIGTLSLVNATVDGNTADVNGGGILNGEPGLQGTLNLTNSVISNNSGVDGGGVYNDNLSQVTIVDSTVTGNNSSGDGAGLYNDSQSTITISRSSISGNVADLDGGGIYNNDLANLSIADSKVNGNSASQGGGIFNSESAVLDLLRTTISGNTTVLGGAGIYNDGGGATLDDVSILTNVSHLDGGGLYNATGGEISIKNSYFDNNSADRDGGSIANFGYSLSISDTTIRDSEAHRFGGGIYNDQEEGSVSLLSSTIYNNQAVNGGGIYNQELGVLNLDLSDVLQNSADSDGGGIYNTSSATLNVKRTTVDGNQALNGAGIYNDDVAQLNLDDSTVSNNVASGDGGGLYNNSIVLASVVNATISGNASANYGGGILNSSDGSIEITNATIYNNASGEGGGVFNQTDGFVSVANTIIAGNSSSVVTAVPDVSGDFNSRGNNLIGVGGTATGFVNNTDGDMVGTYVDPISPGLGALQDNGGATFTHELLGGSLARDAGNNFYAPTDDQRGFARLFDGDGNGSLVVDIGAFESGYIVTGFGDSVDVNPGDGVSVDANGQSTLRAAIIESNSREGADTILLGTGVYTLSLFGLGEDNAYQGDLDITDDLTIIGAGSGKTIIDANYLDRIFQIFTGVNVSLRGVTLVNGNVTRVEDGGAILNFGTLSLEDVVIKNSLANRGGALFNNGITTIKDSRFEHNTAIADGGAIYNNLTGTVSLTTSMVTDNNAEKGGGIYNVSGATLEVIDTTLDDNSATISGGGIFNASSVSFGAGEGGGDGTPVEPPTDPQPVSDFSIDVVFTDSSLSASQQAVFQEAASRWSEIILDDVPDVIIAGIGLVDDLRIEASATAIDGVNGILGQAGPGWVRPGSFIPATGVMQFDTADLAALEASGELLSVILHEMGHVLGFGTIWENLGLVVGAGTSDPRYIGNNAIDEYNSLLGRDVTSIPLENTGGPGTADSHWLETDLVNELMTGYLNSGVGNPISGITVASLADLGYVVDLSAADPYPTAATGLQYSQISTGEMIYTAPEVLSDPVSLVSVEAGSGSVVISNSTISNNFAGTRGGGLLNQNPIELTNVTISGNEAGKAGGGIHNIGELTVNNTTIYNNTTEGSGGGVYSTANSSVVNIQNTIIAGNAALVSGADVEGDFTSAGHNLIGTGESSTGFVDGFNGDIVGSDLQRIDPFLSPLQDNGGPTFTHALLQGSLAIDAGDNTDGVATDQRGASRPTDDTSDIGAFEIVTPTISISDVTQLESNAGETSVFQFVVSLSNPNVDEVTVDFETSNGTATAGIDYEFTTGSVTFSAGETTQVVQVIVNGDDDVEDHETFFVNLFNASGAAIDKSQGVGTIQNDEASISINDVTLKEGPVGTTTNFEFTVSLSTPVAGVVSVSLKTEDVSATIGDSDYVQQLPQTITFAPNETEKTITVVVNGDSNIEDDETFKVVLSSPSSNATIADAEGIGTIENDDFALLSVSDVTLTENYDGGATTTFHFTVSLSQATSTNVTFDISTVDDTAQAGSDYVANSISGLVIPAYATEVTFDVVVNNDALNEPNETFYVVIDDTFNPPLNANILDGTGVGTIVDNGIVVDTLDDNDAVNAPGGLISLREAIDIANASPGVDNIILGPGVYHMGKTGAGENNNATGDYDITDDLNIFGQGTGQTIIDADPDYVDDNNRGALPPIDRIFQTATGVSLHLSNMELRNGDADDGGAILAQGPTTLDQIIFRNNTADFLGGAIVSQTTLDVNDAQFINNHSGYQGGAIYQYADTATVARTTFEGNTSDGRAGGVYVASAAALDVSASLFYLNGSGSRGGAIYNEGSVTSTNVTFSANHSGSRGGAIFNDGDLSLINNTLTLNTADQTGGGISNNSAVNSSAIVKLLNTIVANNTGVLGNDDLGGAYDTANSFNNLIGNIDAATGLTDGDNGNLVGSPSAELDPGLGILLDNGGPTKTHLLLTDSPAIDAGRINGAPTVDQRGNARPVDGDGDSTPIIDIGAVEIDTPTAAPLYGTGGDSSVLDEQTNIEISVVKNRTSLSNNGTTMALPGNLDWVDEWDSFWVEVWVDTANGFGISNVLTDLVYNTAYFTATSIEFSSNFNYNRTAIIDDEAGVVRNLGGSTSSANVGGSGHALLARIRFEALANDQVEVDPTDLTLNPLQLGLDVQNTEIGIVGVGDVTVNVGDMPQTDLYPVIYDINDDDSIDYRDLSFFASAYNQNVLTASSNYAAALDFNKNGRVDFKDLTLLAVNYNKRKSGNTEVTFPTNFGQKWIGTQLEVNSGDDTIDDVVQAAVNTWETALGMDEPLEVQVIVKDFGTAQLGSGQTTDYNVDGVPVAGRVVIDDDANGLGWNVDVTDAPTAGGYDLYTVLLHEIGHVLGFSRYYSGFSNLIENDGNGNLTFVGSDFTVDLDSTGLHIDDAAIGDDLMNDTLDPGMRKSISDLDVKMLLESYASVSGGAGGGTSSPIYGTNTVPTAEPVEPTLVQCTAAAQTFVAESTVSLAAPAVMTPSKDESADDSLSQSVTFDAIQPALMTDQNLLADKQVLDGSLVEDLYSSDDFENGFRDVDTDDRELVFAHTDDDLDLEAGYELDQETMDDAFSNWEGPLL